MSQQQIGLSSHRQYTMVLPEAILACREAFESDSTCGQKSLEELMSVGCFSIGLFEQQCNEIMLSTDERQYCPKPSAEQKDPDKAPEEIAHRRYSSYTRDTGC